MATLFGLNKPNTNLRKNVFDLSEKSLYSLSAGMLLPVMCKEANPGEKFQINLSSITRTMPLNTAAFVRCRQYYHFFFVPYKQLWSGWDNFINGVDYKTSALQANKKYYSIPALDLSGYLVSMIRSKRFIALSDTPYFIPTNKRYKRSERDSSEVPEGKVFDRNTFLTDTKYEATRKLSLDEHGYLYSAGASRLFDMLGYGFNFKKTTRRGSRIDEYSSIYDYLKYLFSGVVHLDNTSVLDPILEKISRWRFQVNPFRLLAYQKIYNDFYKRDDYEATNPLAWNIDDLANGSFDNLDDSRLLEMTRLRYRWLPKDYITGVVPSELYGIENDIYPTSLDGINDDEIQLDDSRNSLKINVDNYGISTKSIRAAFAIEKLMRLGRRAGGNDYISQTAAHFGFEPPKGRGDKVEFIGGFTNDINISEVLTTTNYATEFEGQKFGNTVGQIYGKGIGINSNNKEIEYQAKEHGVIMCITSVVPELDYNGVGMNRFNTKLERGDYFHPEFQDLGLQPVFGYELNNTFDIPEDNIESAVVYGPLGFAPMYSEYKTAIDTLHGEFRNGKSLSAWSASSLVNNQSVDNMYGVNRSTLKINPKCLDRLFTQDYDGTELTDQFMCSSQFIVKAIRPMSVTGQNL